MTSPPLAGRPPASVPGAAAPPRRAGRMLPLIVFSVALAAVSLATPATLGYDPWAWLVWGREATRGTLSTAGGPTWKPLPVLVTTLLAYAGDTAPELWLVLARAGGLVATVLTYRLAARAARGACGAGPEDAARGACGAGPEDAARGACGAGPEDAARGACGAGPEDTARGAVPDDTARFAGPVAGVVAVLALLLTPDAESRWIRLILQGNVEPLLVALCLGAVLCGLDRRPGVALVLGAAAALLRPEAWPFLGLYALWLLVVHRSRWPLLAPLLLAVLTTAPVLWLGGDWLVSGDPWSGAARAQVLEGGTAQRLAATVGRLGGVVIVPVWVAAAAGVAWAIRVRARAPVVLAAGALVWIALVATMAGLLGYAALSRFLAPPGAVLCVLAGFGVARTLAAVGHRGRRAALAATLVAAVLPFAVPRAAWLPRQVAEAGERARIEADLDRALALAGGRDALLRCGTLAVDATTPVDQYARPALAWKLDVPLARVDYALAGRPGVAILRTGSPATLGGPGGRVLAETARWTVLTVGCPAPPRSSPAEPPR